ncbi:hypothetical protein [Aquimarina sp. 2201CG5-10]|uniref:hypothetical protein n=1 Tax=Aquimarina callyspongiae TaxID=3098150 RepID=UPI002AB4B8AE|nr:hypothetical protein [Aquimarina sp. 2201CG5-10]MDY8138484.1 hypothetical protein [Aquimarina sp. 2201CG5-10]
MFETIKHRLSKDLIAYFDKVDEFKIMDEDLKTYYIFYKPYSDLNYSLIYDPYTQILLRGDANCAANETLDRYLVHVIEEKDMTLDEFCKWEGVTKIK